MARRKPTIDDYLWAIVERDRGMPYALVLDIYGLEPNRFAKVVSRGLDTHIKSASGNVRKILEEIANDRERRRELFNMGEEFVQMQYERIRSGEQTQFYPGTHKHPKNMQALVYYALTLNKPKLKSSHRRKVIDAIKSLPKNLPSYFHSIGLGGFMDNALSKRRCPLAVLEIFDKAYQEKTGDASLFDSSQEVHLQEVHLYKGGRHPNRYWRNPSNVEEAVYRALTEEHPVLVSADRNKVVNAIKSLPRSLKNYFLSLGLGGLMIKAFEKGKRGSPSAVLEVFDKVYQKKTGNPSLFDKTQDNYIEFSKGKKKMLIR
ncbi:hypothetical protein KY339_00745 [Candidatus Woesearchaeota archaeon]|nr:hypothetical protein [Candidatus Woesearchaeota archaeon]